MGKKITKEEFEQEVYNLVKNEYTILSEYVNKNTHIKIRHNSNNCNNYEWLITPSHFLRGVRCPKCNKCLKKTTQEFKDEVYNLVQSEYEILEEYIGAHKKIKIKHNNKNCDNFIYNVTPHDFLKGVRCPKCAGNIKKTTQEFRNEVYDLVQNEYEVLEEYVNSKTKIKMRHNCKKCNNYEYKVTPSAFLRRNRCPKCFRNIKKTTEEFKKEVYNLVQNEYKVLGEYVDYQTKIKMRHNCKKCNNYEYEVVPGCFLKGNRCPKCFGSLRKTNKEFVKEVYVLVGNEYSFLEEYVNSKTKIKIRHNCEKCNNYEYEIVPNEFLLGSRCPKCSGKQLKTTQKFKNEVYDLVQNEYDVIGEYINNKTKIKIRHNCEKCNNYEYEVTPQNFLSGCRCPKCFGGVKSTNKEFKEKVYNLVKDEYIFLEEYQNAQTKIKVRHNSNKCNYFEYKVTPSNFLTGYRCPKCNESKGEKEISNYLDLLKITYKKEYKFNDCKDKNFLRFDFAIFKDDNLLGLIEFDGIQHFKEISLFGGQEYLKETQKKDKIKTTYCKENNIPLLRIKYTQFDNIEQILDSFLSTFQET